MVKTCVGCAPSDRNRMALLEGRNACSPLSVSSLSSFPSPLAASPPSLAPALPPLRAIFTSSGASPLAASVRPPLLLLPPWFDSAASKLPRVPDASNLPRLVSSRLSRWLWMSRLVLCVPLEPGIVSSLPRPLSPRPPLLLLWDVTCSQGVSPVSY